MRLDVLIGPMSARARKLLRRAAERGCRVRDVHELRVLARRLEIGIEWAAGAGESGAREAVAMLRRVRSRAGRVRDCDVAAKLLAGVCTDPKRLRLINDCIDRRREDAERRLAKLAGSRRVKRVWKATPELIGGVSITRGVACRRLARLLGLAVRRAGAVDGDAEMLHRVRIALKRLRYGAEFALPLLGAAAGDLARRAERATELIGRSLDIGVLVGVVDGVLADEPSAGTLLKPLRDRLDRWWRRARLGAERGLSRFVAGAGSARLLAGVRGVDASVRA